MPSLQKCLGDAIKNKGISEAEAKRHLDEVIARLRQNPFRNQRDIEREVIDDYLLELQSEMKDIRGQIAPHVKAKVTEVTPVTTEEKPAELPRAETKVPTVKSTFPPNSVIRDVRDTNGNKLGQIVEPYDGTEKGAKEAAQKASKRMDSEYADASHIQSRIGATDENGNSKWVVSPNFVHVVPANTPEAAYIFGDVSQTPPSADAVTLPSEKAAPAISINDIPHKVLKVAAKGSPWFGGYQATVTEGSHKGVVAFANNAEDAKRDMLRAVADREKKGIKNLETKPAKAETKTAKPEPKQPKTKITSTDTALRRYWELRSNRIDESASKPAAEQLAAIQKETSRADLLDVPLAEDATPGARRLLEDIRGNIKPFTEWAGSEAGGRRGGSRRYRRTTFAEALTDVFGKEASSHLTPDNVRARAKAYIEVNELGNAEVIEEVKHGNDTFTYVRGCSNPKALTILIHGGTEHVLDEIERAVKDGLGDVACSLKDGLVVPGGGAIEIELARRLREFGQSLSGREQLAIEEFASALEFIPITLAENAGMDPIDVLTELKSRHDSGERNAGLNLFTNRIENMLDSRIIEPFRIKQQAINSATDVSVMILRIDDVIASSGSGKSMGKLPQGMDDY